MGVLGKHTLRDIDITGLAATFDTATKSGLAALQKRLEEPLADRAALEARQAEMRAVRRACKDHRLDIDTARATLRETEDDALAVADAASDARHAEYYTQILWPADSRFAWLNEHGWLNELMVFFRTMFLPGMALLLPLVVFVAPFILYSFVLKKPLTVREYFTMLQGALKKAVPSVLGAPRFAGRGGIAEVGEQFIHIVVAIVMFGASVWNQVSAALNMRRVAADMRRRAAAVRRFTDATRALGAALGRPVDLEHTWAAGDLGLFGDAWNDPGRVRQVLAVAGELDMLAAVGLQRRVCFPRWGDRVELVDLYHPGLDEGRRVHNSVTMCAAAPAAGDTDVSGAPQAPRNHVLLTGPNRGGKSTLLKSLGAATLMAQTLGVVFARRATLPVFGSIITALAPTDSLGQMSLFEAEIEFAKDVRGTVAEATETSPVFLMMDEIFHGTNAHDGVEASQVFLDELYAAPAAHVYSVVSTHYMDLPTRYGESQTQNLCMDAAVDPADADRLIYTYRLVPGVNRHSSVREILRERGLLVKPAAASRVPAEEKSSQPASKV